jgi:hypothetical protein
LERRTLLEGCLRRRAWVRFRDERRASTRGDIRIVGDVGFVVCLVIVLVVRGWRIEIASDLSLAVC